MQAAPPIQGAEHWLPPRATSAASSYHTTFDHLAISNNGVATGSVDSLISTSAPHNASSGGASSTSAPTTPELEYETIKQTRHGKALVIEHPTLVNFVPTSEVQTAVSITADRVVIDTIFPPTAVWRAERGLPPVGSVQQQRESEKTDKEALNQLLKQHEEQLQQTLKEKLTRNYDPTGTIKEDIFTTLTQVTRFPDPVGTDLKKYTKDQCPCICCEVGCKNPLEPHSEISKAELGAASTVPAPNPASAVRAQTTQPESTQPLESFLDMTETSTRTRNGETYGKEAKNKHRFAFLTFGRFGRSRSSVDLSRTSASDASSTAMPVAAPALPAEVTSSVVSPPRSRSFANLVSRRRSKHMATASMSKATSPTLSQEPITSDLPTTPRVDSTQSLARQARHSLDSTRPRVDTPLSAPVPPPRRSSKIYGLVHRKPIPAQFASTARGSMPNATMSMYNIGQIVEEDEPSDGGSKGVNMAGVGAGRASWDKRQSGLVSSYQIPNVGRTIAQMPQTTEQDSTQIGLAL